MAAKPSKGQCLAKSIGPEFTPLPELPAVYAARKGNLSMFALPLRAAGVCVISPVKGLAEKNRARLTEIGPVRFLFAPNHYHNLGLEEYSEAYPDAKLIAPVASIARLQKVTGLSFSAPDELVGALPEGVTLIETCGLKTGENWVRVQSNRSTAWIVADAFCGADMYGDIAGPELLKPFPKFGIGNKDQYLPWLEQQLGQDQPNTLVPCHGSAVQAPELSKQLLKLVTERLCR